MKPIDYIYKNLDSFNISIFKQIVEESGEEVSESIYDYLMETTWNTNPALLKQFGLDIERSSEDGEMKGEIVFTGIFPLNWDSYNDASYTRTELPFVDYTKIDTTKTYKITMDFITGKKGECETLFSDNYWASIDEAFADSYLDMGSSLFVTTNTIGLELYATFNDEDEVRQEYGDSVTVTIEEI